MKYKLPRLTPFIVVAIATALVATSWKKKEGAAEPATASETAQSAPPLSTTPTQQKKPPSVGDQLITQAASRLERRASVSARLRHQVYLSGSPLYGIGSYWQQGSGEDLRVRLELQIAGQDANLLQVSDSRFLWLERNLPTGRMVSRVDLRQLRADPSISPAHLDGPEPGSASWTASGLISHTGGLPSLLASLGENFSFLPPQAMRLAAQTTDPQTSSIPVFAVVGHWRPEKIAALVTKGQAGIDGSQQSPSDSPLPTSHSPLPSRLPREVLLLVGQSDLFPYRIEYRKLETPRFNPNGPPIPYQLSANPMVVLEMNDVTFDVQIETGQFDYAPGDADFTDQTAVVLERLRQDRNQLAERLPGSAETSRK
jgi:hypothetical protein